MLKNLQDAGEHMVTAFGPRFDLEKVLTTALGILKTLHGRARMRFPCSGSEEFSFTCDEDARVLNDASWEEIHGFYRTCRETEYDVTQFGCDISIGPFCIDLYPLGNDCLRGWADNCQTDSGDDGEKLDPTPRMFVMARRATIDPIDRVHADFIERILSSFKSHGIDYSSLESDEDERLAYEVRFPHGAFGDGYGHLRIQRYFMEVVLDGEEEASS